MNGHCKVRYLQYDLCNNKLMSAIDGHRTKCGMPNRKEQTWETGMLLISVHNAINVIYFGTTWGISVFQTVQKTPLIQGVPLATEPGISLMILTPMKILQRNLNRSTFVV